MKLQSLLASAVLLASGAVAQAGEIYTGIGFPGAVLGYAHVLENGMTARGEFAGGLSASKSGQREGLNYDGSLKSGRVAALLDWYPFGGTFRLTGGVTMNDIKASLKSTGGTGTINGKPVNLAGEFFNLDIKYPSTTPFVGFGWGHQPAKEKGLGFYADFGVQIGSFKPSVQTSMVGKQGVTQADVDSEVNKVKDSLAKLSVLPTAAVGLTYRF